jgi:hypothetical protein
MSTPNNDLLLLVSFPVTGQWGTVEELWSRHHLEATLDALLRRHQLGECTGGEQGPGQQDIDLAVSRASWQAAWKHVRSKLAEQGLLGRATVRLYLDDEDSIQQLWPPAPAPPSPSRAGGDRPRPQRGLPPQPPGRGGALPCRPAIPPTQGPADNPAADRDRQRPRVLEDTAPCGRRTDPGLCD